jgi:hypothetical protein
MTGTQCEELHENTLRTINANPISIPSPVNTKKTWAPWGHAPLLQIFLGLPVCFVIFGLG